MKWPFFVENILTICAVGTPLLILSAPQFRNLEEVSRDLWRPISLCLLNAIKKLHVARNKVFRTLMIVTRETSASELFVRCQIDNFPFLWTIAAYGLRTKYFLNLKFQIIIFFLIFLFTNISFLLISFYWLLFLYMFFLHGINIIHRYWETLLCLWRWLYSFKKSHIIVTLFYYSLYVHTVFNPVFCG